MSVSGEHERERWRGCLGVVLLASTTGCTGRLPEVESSISSTSTGMLTTSVGPVDSSGSESTSTSEATASESTAAGSGGWRHIITMESALLSEGEVQPVADVPVRVQLVPTVTRLIDGGPDDLRFYESGLADPLSFDVERWTPEGAELWVLVPSIGVDPVEIWMEYGVLGAPETPSASEVWPAALGVWHFEDGLADASGSALDGKAEAQPSDDGWIGRCHTYEGSEVDELPLVGGFDEGSVQMWFRARMMQPDNNPDAISIFFHGSAQQDATGVGESYDQLVLRLQRSEPPNLVARASWEALGMARTLAHSGTWYSDTWHHVALTWSVPTFTMRMFVDGEQVDDDGVLESFEFSGLLRLGGVEGLDSRSFAGDLDEVRLYPQPLEPHEVLVEYIAQLPGFAMVGRAMPLP